MRDFKRQRSADHQILNFFILCGGVLLVLALAGFSARAAWGMYQKFAIASEGDAAAQEDLGQLESQHARVSAAVANLSSSRGVEGQVRERFGVARPGEGAIMIVRAATGTPQSGVAAEGNIFNRIFRALFVW